MRFSASRLKNPIVLTDNERARIHQQIDYADCWLWTGYTRPDGYAEMWFRGGPALVIHVAYGTFHGPLGPGLVPDHTCRVRECVNPMHLEGVTQRENVLRGEGIAAANAAKTHCIRGHEFTPENTGPNGPRGRRCLTCKRLADQGRVRHAV